MKLSVTFYIAITTLLLVAVATLVHYNISLSIVLTTVLIGQAWWILTIYKVLTDDYQTDKTFDDWHEDKPIRNE
jgi:hypothetical protein